MKIRDVTQGAPSGWWVIDDRTGAKIKANSYRNLKQTIITHRKANEKPWTNSEIEEMINRQLCARERPEFCMGINDKSYPRHTYPNPSTKWGPGKWAELHQVALQGNLTKAWFDVWSKTLPNAGCGCRRHWNSLIKKHPFQPTFSWTVFMHNQVSNAIGNPQMTEDAARIRWK